MSVSERVRRHRERRRVQAADDGASTSTAALPESMEVQSAAESSDPAEAAGEPMELDFTRNDVMQEHWDAANKRFRAVFTDNPFGLACGVCDRLWFAKDLKKVKVRHMPLLETTFPGEEVAALQLCGTCCKALDANKVLTLSRSNVLSIHPSPSACHHSIPSVLG